MTFLDGVRYEQSFGGPVDPVVVIFGDPVVVVAGVVGVIGLHGPAVFLTSHAREQYAVKHQPAPSVILYIKLSIYKNKNNAVRAKSHYMRKSRQKQLRQPVVIR